MPETETVRPTLEQAYNAAVKSVKEEAVEEALPVESDETETPEKAEEPKAEAQPVEAADEESLLSAEEQKLTGSAREKALNRAWTQKTQQLAKQRKELETYLPLIGSLQKDPKGTLKQLASELGMTVAELKQEAKADTDEFTESLKKSLGPDLEFLADKLAPVLKPYAMQTKSLQDQLEQQRQQVAMEQSKVLMEAFEERHPDWKRHEPRMVEISKKLNPGEGMEDMEYMEILYDLATKPQKEVEVTKKAIGRIEKAASNAEPKESGVNPANIAPRPSSKHPSLEEAYEAAKKGIRWD